jgi:hypothetical protein
MGRCCLLRLRVRPCPRVRLENRQTVRIVPHEERDGAVGTVPVRAHRGPADRELARMPTARHGRYQHPPVVPRAAQRPQHECAVRALHHDVAELQSQRLGEREPDLGRNRCQRIPLGRRRGAKVLMPGCHRREERHGQERQRQELHRDTGPGQTRPVTPPDGCRHAPTLEDRRAAATPSPSGLTTTREAPRSARVPPSAACVPD